MNLTEDQFLDLLIRVTRYDDGISNLIEHRRLAHLTIAEIARRAAYVLWIESIPECEDTAILRAFLKETEETGIRPAFSTE
jgi:hypothetical protein